jgi:hypothetical protein
MYCWFNRATKISDATEEPKLVIEKDETLWCTPNGRVADLKSRSVFSFTQARSRELAKTRRPLDGEALKSKIVELLKLPARRPSPDYRILRPIGGRNYPKPHCTTYAVETEPGIQALVHRLGNEPSVSRPPRGVPRAVLYVAHQSSDVELREEPMVAELLKAEPDAAFYACDVRGIGDSRPDTCGKDQFLLPYGSDFFYAIHGVMLDSPYVGQKTYDLVEVLEWLRAAGHTEVHLAAKGWGTVPATFAAVLTPLVIQVTLKNAMTSYSDVAESESYRWPLSTLVPGVLQHFDLPDCYAALGAKKLRQIEPWSAAEEKTR